MLFKLPTTVFATVSEAFPTLLQSAVVFQSFGIACRAISGDQACQAVLPYGQVCIAGAQPCRQMSVAYTAPLR